MFYMVLKVESPGGCHPKKGDTWCGPPSPPLPCYATAWKYLVYAL
ncbi:unnamed protein product [Acanthoscelides obtectus]|uniref:Uncharacterized protein n=1 Tax=Acanthoscelides obtectus TaxID=200917 RepID=A0A9P0KSE4_ACAOB|nr:unnamed protein product [Acanthoscelides obtectus]CAK1631901.1 hypothetical protein AOBTE_LOCUS7231 [Acanthoscelides obtectus]